MPPERMRAGRRLLAQGWLLAGALSAVLVVACTGPESGDDADPTPIPLAPSTATTEAAVATATLPATATEPASPTTAPIVTAEASPTVGASPTTDGSPAASGNPREALPTLADLPGEGYSIAQEGSRTAQDLANAYEDNTAHLKRLNEWGFKQHVYREFARDPSGPDDPLPPVILATVNEYGSPEQADAAIQWLNRLGTTQGATEVEPPRIGDNVVAITIPTADGEPTASIYVREESFVYVYFAQGGDPLGAVRGIAQKVFDR